MSPKKKSWSDGEEICGKYMSIIIVSKMQNF